MPVKIYSWIDRLAAREDITRSECVCRLVQVAVRKLASKPKSSPKPRPKPKQPWTVNVAWAGYSCSTLVVVSSIAGLIQQIMKV
ncbi:hypothetical protein D8Y20_11395 [Mariprofundus sp. EBB-1]|nr:hypothetical protein D8Y20_11395 [Mariprofundus sp. EBB-1]